MFKLGAMVNLIPVVATLSINLLHIDDIGYDLVIFRCGKNILGKMEH